MRVIKLTNANKLTFSWNGTRTGLVMSASIPMNWAKEAPDQFKQIVKEGQPLIKTKRGTTHR